jgi:hypothetical protein
MSKAKLNIRGLSIPDRVARGRQIVTALTGNPAFSKPQPPLPDITATIDALEAGYANNQAAKQAAITSTTVLHDLDVVFETELGKLRSYVDSVATDDKTIQSAGMGVAGKAGPLLPATTPAALAVSEGDHDGTLDCSYDRVKGAKSYIIEMSLDPPTATSWKHAAVSVKSSVTITGLASGTRYWFRVAAVTAAGQSGWSDPATKIAP